ncbi:hypothetical protein C1752_01377 [Acaryochloris thomasi RCC1774]|uniref:DUF4870 domain-containing protein n=1 Tax=Acaryochloris thomasi RCC1774 TaxID=1764569 RepID=A0A2W1JME2_9CYAN|nr:hypothetical protein [Acaryochloris thomasi]PZD74376.1 hypothetical protein C1752_01377 [Acaryochloris thomasi RCC1774]
MGIKLIPFGAMEDPREAFDNSTLKRTLLFVYLIPVFGVVPAAWSLTRRQSDRKSRSVSRLAIALGLLWGLGILTLNTGFVFASESGASGTGLSLLVINSVFTSSYFMTMLWLMVRVWQRKPPEIPGVSRLAKFLP